MNRLENWVDQLDHVQPRKLLWINFSIGTFVLLAHGPLLVLPYIAEIKGFEVAPAGTFVSVPLALALIVTAVVALRRVSFITPAIKFHTIILMLCFTATIYYSSVVIIYGIPTGVGFTWNPILYAFLCAYPIYLFRLVFMRDRLHENIWLKCSHIAVAVLSLPVSGVIMWNIWNSGT